MPSIKFAAISILSMSLMATSALALQPQQGGGRGGRGDNAESGEQPRRERRNQPGGGGGGQGGWGGFGGGVMGRWNQMYEAAVTSDDIKTWNTRLKLSADQKQTVEALFEAYQTEFAAEAKTSRDKVDALREEARQAQDMSMMQDIVTERQAFQKKRDALDKSFFEDVKLLLDEPQMQEWPKIERDRRREHSLGQGLIAGERVDVVKLVDDLELTTDQMAPIQPLLDQYRDELDRELVVRIDAYEQSQTKMREMMQGGRMGEMFNPNTPIDPDMEKLVTKGREAGLRVRDVNRKFARQVEPLLPAEKQAAFAADVKRESFPMIYRPAYGTRALDAADKISSLDEAQRGALQGIRESYSRDLSALQTQMEVATEDEQAKFSLQQMRERGPFGMRDGPMGDLERKRRELDDTTADKIKALLTPEQAEQLPARRGEGQGFGGEGGGERGQRRRGGEGAGQNDGGNGNGGNGERQRRRQRGNGQGDRLPDSPA